MRIIISNTSKEPYYRQISQQIKNLIINGELREGDTLPSIRQIAKDLQVSVITTKRAYEELEKEEFIYSIVGKGTFVSKINKELIKEKRLKSMGKKLVDVIDDCKTIGMTLPELIELVTLLFKEEKK